MLIVAVLMMLIVVIFNVDLPNWIGIICMVYLALYASYHLGASLLQQVLILIALASLALFLSIWAAQPLRHALHTALKK